MLTLVVILVFLIIGFVVAGKITDRNVRLGVYIALGLLFVLVLISALQGYLPGIHWGDLD